MGVLWVFLCEMVAVLSETYPTPNGRLLFLHFALDWLPKMEKPGYYGCNHLIRELLHYYEYITKFSINQGKWKA